MIEGPIKELGGVKYRKFTNSEKYKYELACPVKVHLPRFVGCAFRSKFFKMDNKGNLEVLPGYAWDGPSGPTIDRKENFLAGLVHDVLYQALRDRSLHPDQRNDSDKVLAELCIKGGMLKPWAWAVYYPAVRIFGASSARQNNV